MDHSFTKADRLLKRPEYLHLAKIGKRVQNRFFITTFCPGKYEKSRLGITVPKKVGSAAIRNRIKRLSREFFRLNRRNISGHWDINIIAKKEAATLTSDSVFLSLQEIFDSISRKNRH
ncbi:ribonuclease P protein component [Thermodesulfobacteriota bacterium]